MDVYTAVIGKRDRGEYDSRSLPEEAVHRLLQAGRMAGTSSNKQQLRFIAITDPAVKEAISKAAPGAAPVRNAPFAVAFLRERDARDFDIGRAAQNMMIVAHAEGLLSCPVGLWDEDLVRRELGFPDEYVCSLAVAFGYPASDVPARESRPRLPMEEIVHHNRW